MNARQNTQQAEIVEEAIIIRDTHSAYEAGRFLLSQGIPFRTIVRVLAEPERRRQVERIATDHSCS